MRKDCTLFFSCSQKIGVSEQKKKKSSYFYPILALVFLLLLFPLEYRCLSANTVLFAGKQLLQYQKSDLCTVVIHVAVVNVYKRLSKHGLSARQSCVVCKLHCRRLIGSILKLFCLHLPGDSCQ